MDIATLSFSAISAEIKSKMHLNNDKKYSNLTSLVLVSLLRGHLLTNDFEKKIFRNLGEKINNSTLHGQQQDWLHIRYSLKTDELKYTSMLCIPLW